MFLAKFLPNSENGNKVLKSLTFKSFFQQENWHLRVETNLYIFSQKKGGFLSAGDSNKAADI